MTRHCPPWCIADHSAEDDHGVVRHRGATRDVAVVLEGRGDEPARAAELLVELSRTHDEAAAWVYVGDGWTGFPLSLESTARLADALRSVLRDAGTLDASGL